MINVSSEFKRLVYSGEREFIVDATITLSNNTVLNVSNSRIMSNGLEIDDAVGSDEEFDCIGSTIVNSCELILYNNDEIYSDYDFINAKVNVAVKIDTSNGYEVVQKGIFTVDEAVFSDVSVTLTLLDNMCQFDRPYKSQNIYTSSTTVFDIVSDACTECGVLYAPSMTNMPNKNFIVADAPKDETTYREVIGWCAAIAGCFARCDTQGRLEFAWFNVSAFDADTGTDGGIFDSNTPYYSTGDTLNGGTFNPWNDPNDADGGLFTDSTGIHHINNLNSQNIGVDDVVISAVKIEYEKETDNKTEIKTYPASIVNDSYVITISPIPFINEDNVASFYTTVSTRLIGLRFRTCNIAHVNDPTIEAGDVAWLWDTKGEVHKVLITRVTFSPVALQTIVCGAKTPARNSAKQITALAKTEAKSNRLLNEEKSIREQLATNFNQRIANSPGLYFTKVGSGSSIIIYGHDKSQLAESKMVLKISNGAIAMTSDYKGTDAATSTANAWYGFQFDGTWIANIISTVSLFFDYAHGGTLILGGQGNANGVLVVKDASGTEIGRWDNTGATIAGNIIMVDNVNNVTGSMGSVNYGSWSVVEGKVLWSTKTGFAIKKKSGNNIISSYAIFADSTYIEEQVFGSSYWKKKILLGTEQSAEYYEIKLETGGHFKFTDRNSSRVVEWGGSNGTCLPGIEVSSGGEISVSDDGAVNVTDELIKIGNIYDAYNNPTHRAEININSSTGFIGFYAGANCYLKVSSSNYKFEIPGVQISNNSSINIYQYSIIDINSGEILIDAKTSSSSTNNAYIKLANHTNIDIQSGSQKINGNQIAFQSSSSKRYKHDIKSLEDEELNPHKLLELPVTQFVFNDSHKTQYNDMKGKTIPGFIAEDVAKIYPAATIHNENGEIESWDERRIIPGMLALIQEQQKRIERLENLVKELLNAKTKI